MTLKNDLLIRALFKKECERTPVWLMRQAGRYLPEYRELRQKSGGFLKMCKTPEIACEITLQPINRFPLDAAIIFSDILTVPDAYGLGLEFIQGEGPVFKRPIESEKDIENLLSIDIEQELKYVFEAIKLTKKELDNKIPLIGFAGSPWTVACYMVEGQSSKNFSKIKGMMYKQPMILDKLLTKLSFDTVEYLKSQVKAGADALMVFDTWGGVLSEDSYLNFSLKYMKIIVDELKREFKNKKIPITLFTKNGSNYLEHIANTGCNGVGLDWTVSIKDARNRIGDKVSLQGNIDPCILYAPFAKIESEVKKVLDDYGYGTGHIFNLGHGVNLDVEPENVGFLIDAVQKYSVKYHTDTKVEEI